MLTRNQQAFVEAAIKEFGANSVLTRDGIHHVVETHGVSFPYWMTNKEEYRIGRGQYKLPSLGGEPVSVHTP